MLGTHTQNDVLTVTGLDRLTATNCNHFKELVKAQLKFNESLRHVEVDCTHLKFMDSDGLGALVSVRKVVALRQGLIRLNKVQPTLRRFLQLLKFQELVEIND